MTVDVAGLKASLHELAQQTYSLAVGLQNIAPPQTQTEGKSANSIQYLLKISLRLEEMSRDTTAAPLPPRSDDK